MLFWSGEGRVESNGQAGVAVTVTWGYGMVRTPGWCCRLGAGRCFLLQCCAVRGWYRVGLKIVRLT